MTKQTTKKKVTAKDILALALKKLNVRGAWTKDYYAVNKYGDSVEPQEACKVCAIGAVQYAAATLKGDSRYRSNEYKKATRLLRASLPEPVKKLSVEAFNDRKQTRKKDVLQLFKRALKKASVAA